MIGEQWASYLSEVIPMAASAVQREECKRAFYAGAQAMYTAVLAAVEPEDDDACEMRLLALANELQDFLRLFKAREGV